MDAVSCKAVSNPSEISRMSHIYKLHYNDYKNAINAANKMVKAGQDAGRKTLL